MKQQKLTKEVSYLIFFWLIIFLLPLKIVHPFNQENQSDSLERAVKGITDIFSELMSTPNLSCSTASAGQLSYSDYYDHIEGYLLEVDADHDTDIARYLSDVLKKLMSERRPEEEMINKNIIRLSKLLMMINKSDIDIEKRNSWSTIIVGMLRNFFFRNPMPHTNKKIADNIGSIVEALISIIYSDSFEEVIGQERQPFSIPRMFAKIEVQGQALGKELAKKISSLEIPEDDLATLIGELYPFAILANFQSDVGKKSIKDSTREIDTYINELKMQFKIIPSRGYMTRMSSVLTQLEVEYASN